jgi:nicotinamidase/pyrazinamidase
MAITTTKIGILVIDVQGDFTKLKNGSLAVDGTDEVYIKTVEKNAKRLKEAGFPIYATQDWHPGDHVSFFIGHKGSKAFDIIQLNGKNQVLWTPHCVQQSPGAEILLDKKLFKAIVRKGMDPQFDSYSGFQDDGGKKTELDKILKRDQISNVVIYGLTTDYCVRATSLDAIAAGYRVIVIKGLSRGVAPDTTQKALEEMRAKGVMILDEVDLNEIKGQ